MKILSHDARPRNPIFVGVNRLHIGKLPENYPRWDEYNHSFHPEQVTVDILAGIISNGYSYTARVKNSHRHTDNFISRQDIGIDYDNEQVGVSDLNSLQAQPLIRDYAAILHPTSSHTEDKPRSRVIFFLDKPITDAKKYRAYVDALHWYLECKCDESAKEAVRLWYGAPGCEIRTFDNVLPIEVLDAILEAYRDAQQQLEEQAAYEPIAQLEPDAATTAAITEAAPGTRHTTGFNLARHLRDAGLSQAEAAPYMQQYQQAVETLDATHLYTWDEAHATLRSTYRNPKVRRSKSLDDTLSAFERIAWDRKQNANAKEGNVHYTMKTAYAVLDIMRETGATRNVEIAARRLAEYGIKRMSASRHLQAMCKVGLLQLVEAGKQGRGNRYSVPSDMRQSGTNRSEGGTALPYLSHFGAYAELQSLCCFMYGARIHPQLWRAEWDAYDASPFGPAMQKLIAMLATGQAESMRQLAKLAKIGARTIDRHFGTLQRLGLAAQELDGQRRVPYLVDDWYERLMEMLPAFTTFGKLEMNVSKAGDEQSAFHHDKVRWYESTFFFEDGQEGKGRKNPPEHIRERWQYHKGERDKADARYQEEQNAIAAAQAARKRYCQQHGHDFVQIGDNGRPADSKPQQTRVSGRTLSPKKERHTGAQAPTIPNVPDNGKLHRGQHRVKEIFPELEFAA